MERHALSGQHPPCTGSAHQDQLLPGVYGAGLPGALRSGLYLRPERRQRDRPGKRTFHHRRSLRKGLDAAPAASDPFGKADRHRWQRPLRAGGGLCAQPPGSFRDGIREGRPPRRAADVRHSQHEAGQEDRGAPHSPDGGRGRCLPYRHGGGGGCFHRGTAPGVRRGAALLRRRSAPGSEAARPGCGGRVFRRGLSDRRHPTSAGRYAFHRRKGQTGGHRGRRRYGQRLRRHLHSHGMCQRYPAGNDAQAAGKASGEQPLARMAPGTENRLRSAGVHCGLWAGSSSV